MIGETKLNNNFTKFQAILIRIVESSPFQNFIIAAILINTLILALETNQSIAKNYTGHFLISHIIFSIIFLLEILTKLIAWRGKFFKDGWNIFDLIIVCVTTLPGSQEITALRSLRILRLLKLTSALPSLRKVIETIFKAIPGVFSILIVFLIIYLISAIMATLMFQKASPEYFGSIMDSSFTLFQVMTLESWASGVARPIIEVVPYAKIFFVIFIIITNFILINFFVAIFIEATNSSSHSQDERILSIEKKLDMLIKIQEHNNKRDK
ncbi:ion transporter [Hellea sp.]|jgi:voltage-gated sodium channel|nr:ion transporter [Hellea sp.]MDA8997079.1 ion transporter [Hellea sp.]